MAKKTEEVITEPVVEPDVKPAKPTKGKVNKEGRGYVTVATLDPSNTLNVRSGPSLESDIVTTLPIGTRRQVLDAQDGWVKIKEGWVMADRVK